MASAVCDTSVLQYLHQLSLIHLIGGLSERVIVPQAVVDELVVGLAAGIDLPRPEKIDWMSIESPQSVAVLPLVSGLGPGETEVLALGIEMPGTVLLLDDKLARRTAQSLNLPFTGTLGLLLDAKRKHLISAISPILDQLEERGFRISEPTRAQVTKRAGE